MRFLSVLRLKFFRKKQTKLEAPKDSTTAPDAKPKRKKPTKAKRPRTRLDRAFSGIPGHTTSIARLKRSRKNTKVEGIAHRSNPLVRRHDDEGKGVGPTTRMSPVRSTSKYTPWVEDAKHEKNRKNKIPLVAADGAVSFDETLDRYVESAEEVAA